jgi:3-methyladenine DNA glycosylase AlkD
MPPEQVDALNQVIAQFRAQGVASEAGPMAAYMKQIAPFLGLKTPLRRRCSREFLARARAEAWTPAQVLAVMDRLWDLPEREFAYLAIDLLRDRIGVFTYPNLRAATGFIDRRSWWDIVDGLRAPIGRWLLAHREHHPELHAALMQGAMWQRRVAITAQLGWKDATDLALLNQAIAANLADREFFIQKAIGWALRDYARTDPNWVAWFVEANQVTGLARREATKHLA